MNNDWSFKSDSSTTPATSASSSARGYSTKSSKDSAVGLGSILKGIVNFEGPVRVDGYLEGELTCADELVVGEQGTVRANIRAQSVKVFGKVKGDISSEELIELYAGAQVQGSISSPRVVMHDGVTFEGHCRMESSRRSSAKVQETLEKSVVEESSNDSQSELPTDQRPAKAKINNYEGVQSSLEDYQAQRKTFRE